MGERRPSARCSPTRVGNLIISKFPGVVDLASGLASAGRAKRKQFCSHLGVLLEIALLKGSFGGGPFVLCPEWPRCDGRMKGKFQLVIFGAQPFVCGIH